MLIGCGLAVAAIVAATGCGAAVQVPAAPFRYADVRRPVSHTYPTNNYSLDAVLTNAIERPTGVLATNP